MLLLLLLLFFGRVPGVSDAKVSAVVWYSRLVKLRTCSVPSVMEGGSLVETVCPEKDSTVPNVVCGVRVSVQGGTGFFLTFACSAIGASNLWLSPRVVNRKTSSRGSVTLLATLPSR